MVKKIVEITDKQAMTTFYNLLINTLIASITNMTVWFAIVFYAYLQTRSVMATAIMSGIFTLAMALTGIWFGSLVDHNKKKKIMMYSSIFSFVIYVFTFLIYILAPEETFKSIQNPIFWTFVTLILAAVLAGNIRGIALSTIVKILVPEENRDKANGMVGTTMGIAFLIVSVISGFLVGWAGMYYVLILGIVFTAATIIHLYFQEIHEQGIEHLDENGKPKTIDVKGTLAAIKTVPGLLPLIIFTTSNNFLGGVFMSLMDAYGLQLVSVQTWGLIWGGISTAFIFGGIFIAKKGLGKNPLKTMFMALIVIWTISAVFTINPTIYPLAIGMFLYLCVMPFIEASEQTIIQKVVPQDRLGRVFGFAQSVEQSASPITAFVIGPIAQYVTIPFMTTGAGVQLLGPWFGVGEARGIALVFTVAGIIGLIMTILAFNSKYYRQLSHEYLKR